MPQILFVRHAQASAHAQDYDQLSERGHLQADALGAWLVEHQYRFDAVYAGSMHRQQQTLVQIQRAFKRASQAFPEPRSEVSLNEYDFRAVLGAYAAAHPDDPDLQIALSGTTSAWLKVLKRALLAWARGLVGAENLETWVDFQIRVAAVAKMLAQQDGDILVVSSGGVISLFAQRALGLPDESVIALNLALENTGHCHFRVSRTGWYLQSFNALPHLAQAAQQQLHTLI